MPTLKTSPVLRGARLALASLALHAGGAAAATTLHWEQPPGSAPVSSFRVYKGPAVGQGTLAWEGLPQPDASGVYTTVVQVDEIDAGFPVYVWVSAANAYGESAPSNANLYPLGCDLAVDTDCDGVPDAGSPNGLPCATGQTVGCDDNCPFWPNPDQTDDGGVGTGSAPDGIGNACQCGDVSGDGRVTLSDTTMLYNALLNLSVSSLPHPELCNVYGRTACNMGDVLTIQGAQRVPPRSTVQQLCEPALAP